MSEQDAAMDDEYTSQDTPDEDTPAPPPDRNGAPENPSEPPHDGEPNVRDASGDTPDDEDGVDTAEEGAPDEDMWPVERAADLTVDHLPQQLVDEVERPLRGKLQRLGQAFADLQDARNDLINQIENSARQLQSDLKMSAKDSQRINSVHLQDALMREALVDAGVAEDPSQVEAQQPEAGDEDAS